MLRIKQIKKGCVFIETRPLHDLFKTIQEKHLKFIPLDWDITLYLGNQNKHLISPDMFQGRSVSIKIIEKEPFDINDYNNLLTSRAFWEEIPYDKVLIFQSDSEILREGIEEFLMFDYIGAKWKFRPFVGNGGLSLRTKLIMLQIINSYPYVYSNHGNEDVYFSNLISKVNGILATPEQADKFSIETHFVLGSLGFHSIHKYMSQDECQRIMNQYK